MSRPAPCQGPLVRGQGGVTTVRDDRHGGALTTVARPRVQVTVMVMVMVMMEVTPIPRVLDIELTGLGVPELTGAGEGVGVGGAGVAVTMGVTRGQREHSLVITRALDIDLVTRQVILLLDRLLGLLVPPLRDEGGHLHMHRVQLGDARVNVHVP